ncbi:MAG: hypothetical protein J6E38_03350 [Clostridia bacterium]|nr:hypothetical protein [Clostridia bacterium]
MAKDALFRSSIGGYNKNDVNRYIEELGVQYTERGDELEGEIKELKRELEVLPSLRAEKERAEKLSEELEVLKKENSDLSEAIAAQGTELEEKNSSLSAVTAEKDALEMRLKEMGEKEEALRLENARIKAEFELKVKELEALASETESLRKHLEDDKSAFEKRAEEMLIQIQSQAKAVIDKANETAELIISNAKKKAAEAAKGGSDSLSLEAPAKKKDGLSDILESHKSKMDSFFSAITKSFMGDGR